MKHIFKLSLLFVAILLASCEQDYYDEDFPRDVQSGWIEFNRAAQTIDNEVAEHQIPVTLRTSVNKADVSVTIEAELLAGEISEEFLGTKVVNIPANTVSNTIDLELPVDEFALVDPIVDNNIVIRYTMVSTDSERLSLGLSDDSAPTVYTLTISFGCEIDIPLTYEAESYINGNLVTSFEMELTAGSEDGEYVAESLWGPDFVADATGNPDFSGQFVYPGSFLILCDNTIEITGEGSNGLVGGTGSYDDETDEMEFILNQGLFTQDFQVQVILTPL